MSINTYQLLRNVGLSKPRIIRMLPFAKACNFKVDSVVCPLGTKLQPWSHVLSGLVCASAPGKGGSFIPVNVYGPGSWFGEAAILNQQLSTLEYICLTPARVLNMPFAEVLDAFEQEPSFARYIARMVNWRDQQHAEMLTLLRIGSPSQRVVVGLALLSEALLSNASHLLGNELDDYLEIPLKHSLLASLCGVSRGVFSACVKQLAQAGWLRVSYATLDLLHIKSWSRFSNAHRQSRHNFNKPSMQALLAIMQQAAMLEPQWAVQ